MGQVIATVNMKGGVGKTTLSVNLATCLAKYHNKRVLVVDLDTQISATLSLMSPHDFAKFRRERKTLGTLIYKLIKSNSRSKITIQDVITTQVCSINGLDLLPGDIDLYDEYLVSEMLHKKAVDNETNFSNIWSDFEDALIKGILAPIIDNYDYVIMDCAPGYNLLTRSGIAASNFYLLPARPEPLSIVGIQLLERRISKLKETHKAENIVNLQLLGIVFILSGGTLMGRYYNQVMQRVNEDFEESKLFKNRVPMDVNVAKAVDSFMPVVLANPGTSGAKAFVKLTEEFLQKIEGL